jgi:hypothetical protein
MSVVPFPARERDYVALDIALAKGDRRRWFWVHPLETPGTWRGRVFFDGRRHRELVTATLFDIMQFRVQCEDEIREHERDGWVRVESPSKHQRTRARR